MYRIVLWFFLPVAMIFSGCSSISPSAPESKTEKCESPFIYVGTPNIKISENDLEINPEDVKNILQKNIDGDSCMALSENLDAYHFDIEVSSYADSQNKTEIAVNDQEASAGVKVVFSLKKDRSTMQFNSEQTLKVNRKKILGIGKSASISQSDKEELLQKAIQKVYQQVLNSLR